jgi:phage tail sheath protein FI
MPSLVSPGVSVSVTNEALYFAAAAPTVPLFFIATKAGKTQPNGVTPAAGTLESGVVRTVTSLQQSLELYGVPSFRKDSSGNEFHGDSRNEYGLFALNQALGALSRAYVVRADVDLSDAPDTFISFGTPVVLAGSTLYNGIGNGTIATITATDSKVKPQTISILFTSATTFAVSGSVSGYIGAGVVGTPFASSKVNFTITAGVVPFVAGDAYLFDLVYTSVFTGTGNGKLVSLVPDTLAVPETVTIKFTSPTAFTVVGSVSGSGTPGTVGTPYDNMRMQFTVNAGTTPFAVDDQFVVTVTEVTVAAQLGSNDAAKRVTIVTALQAAINGNLDVRSERYEYNIIAAPGYPEVSDELAALASDVLYEAVVIADTPMNKTPDQVAQWALTSSRTSNESVAYYYPWGLASNLDGRDVLIAPSGIAIRTIAVSDQQGYVWSAAAGAQRGVVTGVSKVGYVSGMLGTATTFVEANLNNGQRDNLYEAQKNINPITFFPGRGILVWGQKTSAPANSAMDRLNVVRLVAYLRRVLRKGGMPFVFEPNDQITRDNLKAAADGMLNDIMSKRGLYDYATKCDASNNTGTRIDNNELWLDVGIKPVKTAEFLYIPIRLVSTDTSF